MHIAILEDDAERTQAFRDRLVQVYPEACVTVFDNAPEMLTWLDDPLAMPTLLSLDHDLGPTRHREGGQFEPGTGRDVVDCLVKRTPSFPIIVHSSNGPAASGMVFALEAAGWQAVRICPVNGHSWIAERWLDAVRHLLDRG